MLQSSDRGPIWRRRRGSLLAGGVAVVIAAALLSFSLLGGAGAKRTQVPVRTLMSQAGDDAARGDWAGCIGAFTQVIEAVPADVAALRGRGMCEAGRGDSGAADSDLSRAIAQEPTDPATFIARGQVRYQLGNTAPARADFDHVVDMSEATAADMATAVEGVRALHDPNEAVNTASAAVRRYPDAWETHDELALVYADAGRLPEAFGEFIASAARATGKDQAKVLADRAGLERSSGDLNGAFEDADRAAVIDRRWEYLRLRAEVRQARGDLTGAESDLSQALLVEQQVWWPDATTVHIWLLDERGRLRLQANRVANARSDFADALRLTPPDAAGTRAILQAELAQSGG